MKSTNKPIQRNCCLYCMVLGSNFFFPRVDSPHVSSPSLKSICLPLIPFTYVLAYLFLGWGLRHSTITHTFSLHREPRYPASSWMELGGLLARNPSLFLTQKQERVNQLQHSRGTYRTILLLMLEVDQMFLAATPRRSSGNQRRRFGDASGEIRCHINTL